MYDLRGVISDIKQIVDNHFLGKTGEYCRWIKQDDKNSRDMGNSPYGCANAANILYTIGCLPTIQDERQQFVKVLQSFQNKETGLFESKGNFTLHTTAFLAGALNLFDEKPLYMPIGFEKYKTKEGLYELLESIDWARDPWLGAHKGAGVYASMVLTEYVSDEWEDYYFDWFDNNVDDETGLWRKNALVGTNRFHYLASTFHYVFNYEYAKREFKYAKELLNTCINAYNEGVCMDFSKSIGWADIDFTYLLYRIQRRAGERFEETQKILMEIADGLISQLLNMNIVENESLNDLNTLFAVVCALAVLQDALPGYIRTSKPLKLVIDRRPFL